MPKLISIRHSDMFGLSDDLLLIPDHIALKAVVDLDDFLGRGSSLDPGVVKQLLEVVREEYKAAWPYKVEVLWDQSISDAMERVNFEKLKAASEMMASCSETLHGIKVNNPIFLSENLA